MYFNSYFIALYSFYSCMCFYDCLYYCYCTLSEMTRIKMINQSLFHNYHGSKMKIVKTLYLSTWAPRISSVGLKYCMGLLDIKVVLKLSLYEMFCTCACGNFVRTIQTASAEKGVLIFFSEKKKIFDPYFSPDIWTPFCHPKNFESKCSMGPTH